MDNFNICDELPFALLGSDELQYAINAPLISNTNFKELEFQPFPIDDNRYNSDLDVDLFYTKYRLDSIPKTYYSYLDDYPVINRKCLNLCNFNIRSIPRNLQCFKDVFINNHSLNINVIGLTEIRLEPHLSMLYDIPGYSMFVNSRNAHGGGVAIYVSDKYESLLLYQFTILDTCIETVGIETIISGRKHLFVCVYRPPSGDLKKFLDAMSNLLTTALENNFKCIYIFGDFNINLLKHRGKFVEEFINLMFSFSLFPIITKPTRITDTTASLIDHTWTSQIEDNIHNYIIETDITDHFPTISYFQLDTNLLEPHIIYKRSITNCSIEHFNAKLGEINWNDILNSFSPNDAFDKFFNLFNELYRVHFPVKKCVINKKCEISPYITPALKNSIKERNRLERLAKKWPITYGETYKKYRNQLTSTLRNAKNAYFKNKLNSNQGNPHKQWKLLNPLLGRSNTGKSNIELIPACDDISTKFNEHFLSHNDVIEYNDTYKQYLHSPPEFSMYLAPTNQYEVQKLLSMTKTEAPGYDDISPKVLKHCSSIISAPMAHIINVCLKSGNFPDNLKIAKVLPIFKSGNRKDINNYRPISILPAFSKVFEKIIAHRLINYLESHKLLIDQQHGFRANHSTETAILQLVSNVYRGLEEKLNILGIFLDLSKAFDTLDHDILLYKLNNLGIRGIPHKLFKSYLSNRQQCVFTNGSHSKLMSVSKGVPQGSVLGPLLFLTYINDIVNSSNMFTFVIYADDTTLLLKDCNIAALHATAMIELKKVNGWISANKLRLNISKTSYTLFQNRSIKNLMPTVMLNNESLKQVSSTKFLGIIVDENLNWKLHIDHVCSKLSKVVGVLYRVRHNLTTEAMISIYYTLCYPYFTYCVSVWACTWQSFLGKLTIAQNKIFRSIFFLKKFDSVTDVLSEAKILKFPTLHKYFILMMIYKNLGKNDIFSLVSNTAHTRSNNVNLMSPIFRTTLFKNSIITFGPKLFNSLPIDIKMLLKTSNFAKFKREVKQYLYSQQNSA